MAALALKVITLFALFSAMMYFDVAGKLRVYDVAVFVVSTPIVWIAGYRIYKGAYQSFRNRDINVGCVGHCRSSIGWIYGS